MDILQEMTSLLQKNYGTEDSIGLMLDRLREAGCPVTAKFNSDIEYNEHVRKVYWSWVTSDSKSVLSVALLALKGNLKTEEITIQYGDYVATVCRHRGKVKITEFSNPSFVGASGDAKLVVAKYQQFLGLVQEAIFRLSGQTKAQKSEAVRDDGPDYGDGD